LSAEREALGTAPAYVQPEALMRLAGLKLRARKVVEGVLSGLHRSPHKGSSVEFAEYKEYTLGDEIRHIDWKAYGKSDKYYVKQYEEETNLRAFILLDVSGSMGFAGKDIAKLEYGKILAISLTYLLLRQADAVGLLLFDEKPSVFIPPSNKLTHVDDLILLLEGTSAGALKTNIVAALSRIAEQVRQRSLVILISDMLQRDDQVGHLLKVLHSRGMDVLLFHLVDPHELDLPYEGLSLFEGFEGEEQLLVDPDDIRAAYQQALDGFLAALERVCREANTDYHRVLTNTPLEEVLLEVLMGRLASSRARTRR